MGGRGLYTPLCEGFIKNTKPGGVTEWSKVADCKSVGKSHVGSNPTPLSISKFNRIWVRNFQDHTIIKNRVLFSRRSLRKGGRRTYIPIYKIVVFFKIKLKKWRKWRILSKTPPLNYNVYRDSLESFRAYVEPLTYSTFNFLEELDKRYTELIGTFDDLDNLYLPLTGCLKFNDSFNYVTPLKLLSLFKLYLYKFVFTTNIDLLSFRNTSSFFPKFKYKHILFLNFKRKRFFPSLQSLKRQVYMTYSLGMFSKFFNKGKSFIKNKLVFITMAGFLRKVMLFAVIRELLLVVRRTPLYLSELLSTINLPVIVNYKHPFLKTNVDELELTSFFMFHYFIFINSKPYSFMKSKKKGRVKRKITKRIVKINQLID